MLLLVKHKLMCDFVKDNHPAGVCLLTWLEVIVACISYLIVLDQLIQENKAKIQIENKPPTAA